MRTKRNKKKGAIALLVITSMILFGCVAIMWAVSGLAVGSVQRTYDNFRQTLNDDARLERVVQESLQAIRGTQFDRSEQTIAQEVATRVAAVNSTLPEDSPLLATVVSTPGSIPDLPMFPDPATPALGSVGSELRALARQEILDLTGPRVATTALMNFDFSRGHVVFGQNNPWPTRVAAMLVSAPLTAHRLVSYVLPRNVMDPGGYTRFFPPAQSPLPGGIAGGNVNSGGAFWPIDPAFVGHLRTWGQLPYHFRQRAVMSAAYQYVFSGSYVQAVMNGAGVTHTGDLDMGDRGPPFNPAMTGPWVPVLNPILSGLSEPFPREQFLLDLSAMGYGERVVSSGGGMATISGDKPLVVLYSRGQNFIPKTVRLVDSGGNPNPLMLMIVGGGYETSGGFPISQIRVVIESDIVRPVLMILYNCHLSAATTDMRFNGAIMLDQVCDMPDAEVAPLRLHVAHASWYAFSNNIGQPHFVGDLDMPASAENLAPRVTFVASGRYKP